jgi:hypothetical protein
MVGVLASNAVNSAVDAMAGQTITYTIGICFSAKHAALKTDI